MVHQVPADVGAAEAGGQHQLGVLDGVRGEHVHAAPRDVAREAGRRRVLVALVFDAKHLAGLGIDADLARHGLREQAHAATPTAAALRLRQRLHRIVFGLHRADRRAGRVALASLADERVDRAVVPQVDRAERHVAAARHAVARGRVAAHLQRVALAGEIDAQPVDARGELLVRPARRDAPHRVVVARREGEAVVRLIGDVGGDAERGLGLAVPGLEVVVGQRPVDADAVARAQREVLRQHPQRDAEPVQRRAAGAARVGRPVCLRPLLHEIAGAMREIGAVGLRRAGARRPRRFGTFRCVGVEGLELRLVTVARHRAGRPRLEHQHAEAGLAEPLGGQRPGDAGADDDRVVTLVGKRRHGVLVSGGSAQAP